MQLQHLSFPEAAPADFAMGEPRWLVARRGEERPDWPCVTTRTAPATGELSGTESGGSPEPGEAGPGAALVTGGFAGAQALHGRGLTEATIRAARLGWTSRTAIPGRDEVRFFRASGLIIPWFDGVRLTMVKIRQPDDRKPKYIEAFRHGPRVFPSLTIVRTAAPLILVEGEFDALLLNQELGSLAAVVTMGSASARPDMQVLWRFADAQPMYAAHDADPAGDRAAGSSSSRAIRVQPPAGKDWTEAHQAGINLRRWWVENVFPLNGPFAAEERAAIVEFDGGLTREATERTAGISSSTLGDLPS